MRTAMRTLFLAALCASGALGIDAAPLNPVAVVPSGQDSVVISQAAWRLDDRAMPVVDVTMQTAPGVSSIRALVVFTDATGKPYAFEGRSVLPGSRAVIPLGDRFVDTDTRLSIVLSRVRTGAGTWVADPVSVVAGIAGRERVRGMWTPHDSATPEPAPATVTGDCGPDFCAHERAACRDLCGAMCVEYFSCNRKECATSCHCKSVKACNPGAAFADTVVPLAPQAERGPACVPAP